MSTLYRRGKLGDSLVEALDVLITEEKISPDLAMEVLSKFDDSMARTLDKEVSAKASLKGKLDVYRYIDNVWTFVLSNASLRLAHHMSTPKKDEEEVEVEGLLKMVLVDSKLVQKPKEEDARP